MYGTCGDVGKGVGILEAWKHHRVAEREWQYTTAWTIYFSAKIKLTTATACNETVSF